MLAWLSVWSKVQTCIWPSWCHCHSLSLASVKFRLVLPFWYWLTRVVLAKGPLNACVLLPSTLWYSKLGERKGIIIITRWHAHQVNTNTIFCHKEQPYAWMETEFKVYEIDADSSLSGLTGESSPQKSLKGLLLGQTAEVKKYWLTQVHLESGEGKWKTRS